ncbi:UNVERIFIED_CONTAM: syntaxin [Sesamum radiatum]|uniref:Syntaxin n=1 Tax=Sesamum radiatum TaxID=300843 RepID=A0AAW2R3H8_SESRA
MNDLFSGSFSRFRGQDQSPTQDSHTIEMTNSGSTGGVNLDRFFEDVEAVKDELGDLESLYTQLQAAHEQSKTLHSAKPSKTPVPHGRRYLRRSQKSKVIKVRLEALDRSNAANRSLPGCGPGSSSDRTRTSVVNGLRKKLHDTMTRFNDLRQKMGSEYRETVQRDTTR